MRPIPASSAPRAITALKRGCLLLLIGSLLSSCADPRPALTPAGLPDPSRRMALLGWYLDPARPKEAAVLTFAYPAETTLYHSQTLELGHRLYQYQLDAIDEAVPPLNIPQLHVTDLDTRSQVVLKQDFEVNRTRVFSEEAMTPTRAPSLQ